MEKTCINLLAALHRSLNHGKMSLMPENCRLVPNCLHAYNIYKLFKKCYVILTFIFISLYIMQGIEFYTKLTKKIAPILVPYLPFYIFVFIWFYITGINITVKSIYYFKNKNIVLGLILLIISICIFIFSQNIVLYILMFIYPNV